jgi:hypothetical protein
MINDILTARSRPLHRPDQHPQLYNSHLSTTGQTTAVRYAIEDELWESFTVEQVRKQIGLLRETGRFREPNNGGPFVVRVSQYALMGDPAVIAQRDILVKQGHLNVSRTEDAQCFYDFSFDGDTVSTTVVTRLRLPGSLNWKPQQRGEYERKIADVLLWKEEIIRIWWEKDYVCVRCRVLQDECEEHSEIAWMAANVVVILLQDRTANKIEIEPKRSKALNLNFIKRRPKIPDGENAHEIVLTIPRRVYKSEKTGKPHGPHRMHYRAEHVRRQQIGPRSAPSYKEIVIPGMWINADDISPADLGTPITRRYYRFKALRQKEKLHTS